MTAGWLCAMSGYTDKPVTTALSLLTEYQMIVRVQGGWMVSGGAVQLPLVLDLKNRNISDSSSCSSLNKNGLISVGKEQEPEPENRNYSENLKTLHGFGIRDPKASLLAGLSHVTPDFIRGHVEQADQDGHSVGTAIHRIENNWALRLKKEAKPSVFSTLLARRQEDDDDADHPEDCDCITCKREP